MGDPKLDRIVRAWDDAEVRACRLAAEVERQRGRVRGAWRTTAVAAAVAVAIGGGWLVDRGLVSPGLDAAVEADVRRVLAAWADVLETGVRGTVTDDQLRAASVDPDGAGIKYLLRVVPTVREDYDGVPLDFSYQVDRISHTSEAITVWAHVLVYPRGRAERPTTDNAVSQRRILTLVRTNLAVPRKVVGDPTEAAAVADAYATAEADITGAAPAASDEPPADLSDYTDDWPDYPVHKDVALVRLVRDVSDEHCCMPLFP